MPRSFSHLTSRCFVCVPFLRLKNDLKAILSNRIQPEIGLEGDVLYTTGPAEFKTIAGQLKAEGLGCTIHAPFGDLSPGASDNYIQTVSRDKLAMAFHLLEIFEPAAIVCHLNYEENKHGYKQEEWFDKSMDTWQRLLVTAEQHQVPLMLENTYETDPAMHRRILETLDSPYARFCLDVGHTLVFARNSWQEWLPALSPWLGQLHLHDNHGDRDDHLAIGEGRFDFIGLFNFLEANSLDPLITLEPHDEETLWKCLENLDRMGIMKEGLKD